MALDESGLGNPSAEKPRGAGGTPGGLGEFFTGLAMAIGGGYLLLQQVTVSSGYWQLWGYNAFGFSLIPLLIGIALLFFDGRSKLGWLLTAGGALIIFLGIITKLCNKAVWLDHGRIKGFGPAEDVLKEYLASVEAERS